MDEKIQQTLTKYLGDLHALESHGADAIARQIEDTRGKGHLEAFRAFEEFKRALDTHIRALDDQIKSMGGSPTSPVKDIVASAAGMVAGIYGSLRDEAASKMLRDDYAFFSLDAVSYSMFHTTALALGDESSAKLAEQGYRDCARILSEINPLMPKIVHQELVQDGFAAKDVTSQCQRLIEDSWQRRTTPKATTKGTK